MVCWYILNSKEEHMEAKDRIIVAVDVPTLREAHLLCESLAGHVGAFKVGLQLITSEGGPQVVRELSKFGRIFYDGKFNDIPNTIMGASRAVAGMGVWMFNVHASSGIEAMLAATEVKGESLVLAVTVLTSLDDEECQSIFGMGTTVGNKVLTFAKYAVFHGHCDGLICSPKELPFLSHINVLKVVPGVRPDWASKGDQKRVMTPYEAIKAGASHLVIGRPITNPPKEIGDSVEAVKRIADEIDQALANMRR